MLRAIRGFDAVSTNGAPLLFNSATGVDVQRALVTGRDGNGKGLFLFSSAFGQVDFTHVFDAQQTWGLHFDYANCVAGQAPSFAALQFLKIGTSLIVEQRADGKINLRTGSGALIVTSNTSIPAVANSSSPNYVGVELKVTFGVTGSVEMHFDGTRVAIANVNFGAPPYPDRITFHHEGFGPPGWVIDNLAIWDGQSGDRFTTFTGRLRVNTLLPTGDVATHWTPSSGSDCFSRVDSSVGPTGDASFIAPVAGGQDQFFTVQKPVCTNKIYAVALSAAARPVSGAPVLDMLFKGNSTARVIGNARPTAVGRWNGNEPTTLKDYLYYQSIAAENPDTSDTWIDADIENGEFGLGAAVTPALRVSAFYVEKLISLVPQTFDCGGSRYSF